MNEIWDWLGSQWGNLLSALSLLAAIVIFWLSRRPKRFGWQVISSVPIVHAWSRSLPLKVVYDGNDVSSPNFIHLRTGNTGKSEIRAADFDGPVRIAFKTCRILAADVLPGSHVVPSLTKESDTAISFVPSLLNPGEWVDLRLITDGPIEAPSIHARVAGQEGNVMDLTRRGRVVGRIVAIAAWTLIILSFFLAQFVGGEPGRWTSLGVLVLASIAMVVIPWQVSGRNVWAKKADE